MLRVACCQCGAKLDRVAGHVNRARKLGMKLFCNKRCFGLSRRLERTKAEKVAAKRLYDIEYRRRNRATLRAKKAAYHQATYDPVAAAKHRKTRMPYHVEYCRRPDVKAKKHQYDKRRYHAGTYGPWAEVSMLLQDLDAEIASRMSDYEVRLANGTLNKRLQRRREHESSVSGQP